MKVFDGIVVENKMKKTILVEVVHQTVHPLYKKPMKSSKKYKVDTGRFEKVMVGDMVTIGDTRPMSKDKHFRLLSIKTGEKK